MEDIHVFILGVTALAIVYADHEGFAYVRGKKQVLSVALTTWLHRIVWWGLLGMIITGAIMVGPDWRGYLADPVFALKMGFVAVLFVNSFFISKLMAVAHHTPFAELSYRIRFFLFISGAASAMGWIGAAAIGFLFL